jgi:Cytochrome b562
MKTLFIAALLTSAISFAQTTTSGDVTLVTPMFDSLKATMKDMSKKLKTIAAQAKDPSKNADSEKLALELAKSTADAKLHIPTKTAPDKAGQDLYIHMIDGVIQSANDLALAFHENDNAKAIIILSTMSQQKKDGHQRFED